MANETAHPRVGVGAVIWRGDELLLVRRGKPPGAGDWSIPGGRQEPGETVIGTLLREIEEETALTIAVLGLIDVVDAILRDPGGGLVHHYTLIDFSARWVAGEANAGSDVTETTWIRLSDLPRFSLWSETQRIIEMSA